jgi:hypothetical protein
LPTALTVTVASTLTWIPVVDAEVVLPVMVLPPGSAPVPRSMAFLYAAVGDRDHAFEWLERAYRERDPGIIIMKVEIMFDSLRPDPRFTDLLRRVGLPQ